MAVPQIIIYALNQIHALYLINVFLDKFTDFLAVVRVYYAYSDAVIQRPIYLSTNLLNGLSLHISGNHSITSPRFTVT